MIINKSLKWSLGIVVSLGLTACMDNQRSESMGARTNEAAMTQQQHQATMAKTNKPKLQQKTYASKDPTQKATPGPTRKAAPQLPVIQ